MGTTDSPTSSLEELMLEGLLMLLLSIINTSSLSRQLPTLIMFQEGKELGRVPAIHNGKVQKFFFNEEAIVTAFDLNNVYKKCKEDKKFVPFESKESKKEK